MSVQAVSGLAPAVTVPARRPAVHIRQALGVAIAGLAVLPVYRLLERPETGLAGAATVSAAGLNAELVWAGFALLAGLALLASRLVSPERFARTTKSVAAFIERRPTAVWSLGAALVAGTGAAMVSRVVLAGQPNLIDAMSQLLHARFLAAGRLAGPGPELGEFWMMQQSLFTDAGWVSQYPPGQVLALAAGIRLGGAWLVGPLAAAAAAALMVPVAERLLPGARPTARAGAALMAVSPFVLAHAGAFSSHTIALALGVAAVYCALRASRAEAGWSVLAGALAGAMLATRPLSAIALALAIVAFAPLERERTGTRGRRAAAMALGAAPFVAALALYNAHFFGSPLRWGYEAALGPAAGPGFGVDPWGNAYGVREAIGYVSAELGALSLNLLETPLPLVGVVGAFLVAAPRLEPGDRMLAAWALLPLAAHLAYWHHGLFMGPRMLNEMAPAWCLLGTRAAVGLTARLPDRVASITVSPRVFAGSLFALALAPGVLVLGPERLWSYRQRPAAPAAARAAVEPALVFVHGGWTSRLAMRLAAAGLRLDSVETALRQNPTCDVQAWADARRRGRPLPPLDLEPRATGLPDAVEISPGNRIRVRRDAGAALSPACAREVAADRFGVIDVSPLVWRGDLPGDGGGGTLFVRDMGPEENARMIARHPSRNAYVLMTPGVEAAPALLPYAEAMARIWEGA